MMDPWQRCSLAALCVAALLAAATGCTGAASQSGCASCPGCCQNGQCVAVPGPSACGIAGSACVACPSGTSCEGGQCVSLTSGSCGPQTCPTGCCAAGRCVAAYEQQSAQCGTGGQACLGCGGAACVAGRCDPGGGSTYCGPSTCAGCCTPSGQCLQLGGQTVQQCGSSGRSCQACIQGQSCLHGLCQGSGTGQTCNASNCTGCCTPSGQCLLFGHQTDYQCGSGGLACQQCYGGGSCAQGRCGGGNTPGSCGPSNCSGCCTASGQCIPTYGQDPSRCGQGGYACMQCGSSAQCQNGTCGPSCGPGSCSGCCAPDGRCIQPGSQSESQCGSSGYLCHSCSGGQVCTAQGTCAQGAKLLAVLAKTKPKASGSWDDLGGLVGPLPDPYIECTLLSSGKKGKTKPQANTYTASYGNELILSAPTQELYGGLSCQVVDDDGLLGGQPMGTCNVYNVSPGEITVNSCSSYVEQIKLYLTPSY